jgi:hypothetical protein
MSKVTVDGHVSVENIRHTLAYDSLHSVLIIHHQMKTGLMRATMAAKNSITTPRTG